MKEVKLGRVAGPFKEVPYKNFIQSPIGLVPKAGNQTRMIFHLSYDFKNGNRSLNYWTPEDLCTVSYNDLDHAIKNSLRLLEKRGIKKGILFYSKTDLKSAFRAVPLKVEQFSLLIMKAENPLTGEIVKFADKCLPFGASISCFLFQKFSNCLRHIVETLTGKKFQVTNYLDDFLFIETNAAECNRMVRSFLSVCEQIKFPVALEKTVWATNRLVFLGIMLDGISLSLIVPEEKRVKALRLVQQFGDRNKATVRELQVLSGTLNFLNKAIHPGRVFTMRMYAKYAFANCQSDKRRSMESAKFVLRPYHHVRLDAEFRNDCRVWEIFLNHTQAVMRPFVDLDRNSFSAYELEFRTDASGKLGFGCSFGKFWNFGKWDREWLNKEKPSIQYLELFALCMGILTWQEKLQNIRIVIFCDNKGVRDIVNGLASHCKNCMHLLRMLTLNNLRFNRRVFVKYISTKNNFLADSLSRLDIKGFLSKAGIVEKYPSPLAEQIWPVQKVWLSNKH